jgi:putative hydrolase of HD superfamily
MQGVAQYVYELGLLKRIRRTGWWVAGVDDPESVAEHTFRAAVLGYILATLEGADPFRTAVLCLFHDAAESRVGDLHRINSRYLDSQAAEARAFRDQTARLPQEAGDQLIALFDEFRAAETLEAQLARDADMLECLVQAREYQAQGCSSVTDWINNAYAQLSSSSARRLAQACMEMDPKLWWHDLKTTA